MTTVSILVKRNHFLLVGAVGHLVKNVPIGIAQQPNLLVDAVGWLSIYGNILEVESGFLLIP